MSGSNHNYTFINQVSILSRMLALSKHVSDQYHASQNAGPEAEFSAQSVDAIWPEARHALDKGLSMSDFLDTVSEENVLAALKRYEALFAPESQPVADSNFDQEWTVEFDPEQDSAR